MPVARQGDPEVGLAETLHNAGLEATQSAEMAARPPDGAERYQLLGELGRGAMGRVIEATDRQFARTVAIKELHAGRMDEASKRRFVLEAMVTGNLEHPAIVPVYERGVRADGSPFYAMRRVRGRTLAEALAAAPAIVDRLKLLPVVIKTAHALGFAHERGVIHRDVKPSNVIVDRHGETFVLDWGIAKVRGFRLDLEPAGGGSEQAASETGYGSVLGTPAYMAPEQAAGELDRIDERTDVFAIGALLYHLLAGHAPYSAPGSASSVEAALAAAVRADFPPLATTAPDAPAALREICARAMARKPEERYATATELAEALEGATARALEGRSSGLVGVAVAAISVASVCVVLLATFATMRLVPSFHELGFQAFSLVGLCVMGLTLTVVEWLTRGRHALSPLILGLALANICTGVAAAFGGIGLVLHAASSPKILADTAFYRAVVTEGAWESLGNLTVAGQLAAAQFLLWAVVRRHVERARAKKS